MNERRLAGSALRWIGFGCRALGVLSIIQMVVSFNLKPSTAPGWYWNAVAMGLAYHGFTWVGNYVEERGLAFK